MLEIVKSLMEMPEKLGSVLLRVAKLIFTIVLAAKIYTICVGKYYSFPLTDVNAWIEFAMSGRILLCIAFYGIAYAILFQILPIISFLPLKYIAQKYPPSLKIEPGTSSSILKILDSFKLLNVDFKKRRITAALYTEELRDFVQEYSKKETKPEIISIKNSLITDVWHFYFLFVLSYFFYLRPLVHTGWFTFFIIWGLITIPYAYVFISAILDKLHESSQEILQELEDILTQKKIMDTLKELGFFVYDHPTTENGRMIYAINIENIEHLLHCHFSTQPISEHDIRHCNQLIEQLGKPLIFITNTPMSERARGYLTHSGQQNLNIIPIINKEEIKMKLKNGLKKADA